MDRQQAAEIQKHMLEAADAIDRASEIIFKLDAEDRAELAVHLGAITGTLHFELLRAIYDRHPDLRPTDRERPVVSSLLRWEDVVLPANVSEADLDAAIFSALTPRWQKTAMVVGKALKLCKAQIIEATAEILAARVGALARLGRLESEGNLTMWRHSEVRLKQS
jgi:Protein of unknown function